MFEKNKTFINTEHVIANIFFIAGLLNVLFVLVICLYLVISGLPAILQIGPINFLFGSSWSPSRSIPEFGILPFILTSIYGSAGAILLGLPVGFFTAVYISKIASVKTKRALIPLIDLLSGIPSVVYGFVGMLFLVPSVQKIFNLHDGASLFAAIIVLFIMILPSIIKVSITSLDAVDKDFELGSLALGANKIETYFKVVVPKASSGIATAVALGIGRALGEAMAVMMVSGNVANMPSIFESVRFLTTAIASEMAYAADLQRQALFSIALVLFFFILLINAFFNYILKRCKE